MSDRLTYIGKGLFLAVVLSLGSGCLAGTEGDDFDGEAEGIVSDETQALYEDEAAIADDEVLGEEIDLGLVLAELERQAPGNEAFAMADGSATDDHDRSNPEPTPWDPGGEENPEPTPWRGGEDGSHSDNPEPTPWHREQDEDDDDIDLEFAQQASATTSDWDYGWD